MGRADLSAAVEVRDEVRQVPLFGGLAPGAGDELAGHRHGGRVLFGILGGGHCARTWPHSWVYTECTMEMSAGMRVSGGQGRAGRAGGQVRGGGGETHGWSGRPGARGSRSTWGCGRRPARS